MEVPRAERPFMPGYAVARSPTDPIVIEGVHETDGMTHARTIELINRAGASSLDRGADRLDSEG